MAKSFDDEFDEAPEVSTAPESSFDEEFDSAPDQEPKASILDRLMTKGTDLVTPSEDTLETTQDVGEGALDFSKGVAGGLTFNAMDELGGGLGALAEKGLSYIPGTSAHESAQVDEQLKNQGFQVPEESMQDKYRSYQQGIEQDVAASEERSPYLSMAGQLAGGITSGTALGGALGLGGKAGKAESIMDIARNSGKSKAALELLKRGGSNYAKAAPAIAAESALTSKEQLIGPDANPAGVAADVAGGLTFGGLAMGGMQGITDVAAPYASSKVGAVTDKLGQMASDSPLFRQAKLAYQKYGQDLKINPKNERAIKEGIPGVEGGTPFALLDKTRATSIADDVLNKDSQLGAIVGSSIDDATRVGTKIDAQDLVDDTYKNIIQLSKEMPSLTKDANFNNTITKVLSRNYKDASPRDIKNAMEEITTTIDRIKAYGNATPELQEAMNFLRPLRKNLDLRLKARVPEYRESAERFAQYRSTYIEQPIAGGNDPELDDIYYGSMKKGEKKLVGAYEDLVKRSTGDSQAIEGTEERYAKLLQRATEFQRAEEGRVVAGKIQAPITEDPQEFMQKIKDFADDAAVRRSTRHTQESQAGGTIALKNAAGIANTGRGSLLTASYLAGRATSSPMSKNISKTSRALYKAPAESLSNLATKLESTPAFSAVGKALREGLENGSSAKKNAALFTIMQNPNARALISAEDFPDDENME